MNIIKMNSSLISLFEFDKIPNLRLINPLVSSQFQNRFKFNAVEIKPNQQNQPIIEYSLGFYGENTDQSVIKRIGIEERKILIELEGRTSQAKGLLEEVCNFLKEISSYEGELDPIVQSNESIIITRMDFHASKLVDSKFMEFISRRVTEESNSDKGKAVANVFNVLFRIDYDVFDEKLKDYRITLSRKEFSLGPRDGSPLDEQIFISKAPVSTESHIKLLEEIESIYSSR